MPSPSVAVGLDIAGLRASLLTRAPALADLARERFHGFVHDAHADWTIDVATEAGPSDRPDDIVVHRHGDAGRFAVMRHDFSAHLDLPARRASVAIADGSDVGLDAFVRVTWSLALLEVDGLLLHAASLARGERAWLFCGRSGAGKTTLARLSPDAALLSDEVSCIRLAPPGANAYGTPFWGDLARPGANRGIPLAAVYFLEHADRHHRERIAPAEALRRLLPTVLFFARDAELTARVFTIATTLVEQVPCFRLGFRRDPGFWEVIDDA